jgi:hypothetical protein
MGLLEAGDPRGEVRMCWHAKETVRALYEIIDPAAADLFLGELIADMADRSMPIEVRSLAGTLRTWRQQIIAWHTARVSNGPTEAVNNLIKRVKRVAFGMRRPMGAILTEQHAAFALRARLMSMRVRGARRRGVLPSG